MNESWLKPALVGVERPVDLPAEGELGTLLMQLGHGDDPALALSRGIAAIAACTLAAVQGVPSPELPPAAGDDPRALPESHPWTPALAEAFGGGGVVQGHALRLRHEACVHLSKARRTLPFAVLPQALDAGARSQALRAALLPVLGTRGHWLAAHNPDWKFARIEQTSPGLEGMQVWQDGQHGERLAYWRELRASAPADARRLLQDALAELGAKERVEFVAAMSANLHDDDESLLDPLLKDRSREVRIVAARLLARLPASAHALRLSGWMETLVTQRRGLLSKGWECEAPQAPDTVWASAAIDSKRPQHESLGERAWWLYQLVRQVPLSWWNRRTGMTPAQLIAWARKTDWSEALLRGWHDCVDADAPEWVAAMVSAQEYRRHTGTLLSLLPAHEREPYWPRTLAELSAKGTVHEVVTAFAPGETLSAEFSRSLFDSLRACFTQDLLRHDYALRTAVLELAALVHPTALHGALPVERLSDETPSMAECATEFDRTVRLRNAFNTTV